jgi:DNA invertase Pin-like site-specific DNA recombinase
LIRAAVYARCSTDQQREASIEDQVRSCRAWIDKEGWTLVTSYTDHAISRSIRPRPGYQKLLEDARSGEFDVVVAEALDRLSRDQEDVAALYKHLSFAGVKPDYDRRRGNQRASRRPERHDERALSQRS